MPLNSAKVPSPWRKKRSIGIMRSMALISAGGGATLRARERLAQRQQIEQHLDDHAGIAADVAAVGQDLALEFDRRGACVAPRRWRIWPAMQSAA